MERKLCHFRGGSETDQSHRPEKGPAQARQAACLTEVCMSSLTTDILPTTTMPLMPGTEACRSTSVGFAHCRGLVLAGTGDHNEEGNGRGS